MRLTYADQGQPVPHAPLSVIAVQTGRTQFDESETDADGRARINPNPAERIRGSRPFPRKDSHTSWPAEARLAQRRPRAAVNIALPRGVPVQGKVTEEGSGKPVPGALVDFIARGGRIGQGSLMSAHTDADGSFRLGAQPGRDTSSCGVRTTLMCSRPSATGWSGKASREAIGSRRM